MNEGFDERRDVTPGKADVERVAAIARLALGKLIPIQDADRSVEAIYNRHQVMVNALGGAVVQKAIETGVVIGYDSPPLDDEGELVERSDRPFLSPSGARQPTPARR